MPPPKTPKLARISPQNNSMCTANILKPTMCQTQGSEYTKIHKSSRFDIPVGKTCKKSSSLRNAIGKRGQELKEKNAYYMKNSVKGLDGKS